MGGHRVWQEVLEVGSGAELVVLISGSGFSWDELIAADLPRGDKLAELAMLYRPDCPVEFLRKSSFSASVLADPKLPVETARRLLAADPTASEISRLSHRADLTQGELTAVANRGLRLARWHGSRAASYLSLPVLTPLRLTGVAEQHLAEATGLLRNPNCPESVILTHLVARSARVRYAALTAAKSKRLSVDAALLKAARNLPLVEEPRSSFRFGGHCRALASELLKAK